MRTPLALALLLALPTAPAAGPTLVSTAFAAVGVGDHSDGCVVQVTIAARPAEEATPFHVTGGYDGVASFVGCLFEIWPFSGGDEWCDNSVCQGQCEGLADGTLRCWHDDQYGPGGTVDVELVVRPDLTFVYDNQVWESRVEGTVARTP